MISDTKRTFIPGDNWLYFKLYTGFKTADYILTTVLPDIISQLRAMQVLDKWFYLRYSDPHNHLRIRFYIGEIENISQAILIFNNAIEPFVSGGLIWKVQIETYNRELERYGKNTIVSAETIFYHNSEAILRILRIIEENSVDQQRWIIAIVLIDRLYDDFRFNSDKKLEMASSLSKGYKAELGFTQKISKLQLDSKYRDNRTAVENILGKSTDKATWILSAIEIINEQSNRLAPIVNYILEKESLQLLDVPLEKILNSFIHMMINRLFRSKQRLYEMVIYDMLERYYISAKAKLKYNKVIH
jgi:thiopeptide-type bacteriocin biosynthesis protein